VKEIVILSGKGGTGKTTTAAGFAVLAGRCVVADADVDAPDLHLLLHPKKVDGGEFFSGYTAIRDEELCNRCGLCRSTCRFDAIDENLRISPLECEGCGACTLVCPNGAIKMQEAIAGEWFIGQVFTGLMVYAKLKPGKGSSGKLVSLVRGKARAKCREDGLELLITDGPPGIGCPVIAAVGGANLAVVVTEPTAAGLHDLERVIGVCRHFRVPAAVVINKADLNLPVAGRIKSFCKNISVPVLGEIPYDQDVTESIRCGRPLVMYSRGPAAQAIEEVWKEAKRRLEQVRTS
jgi:MinD superfamily P-loop ATPase